MAGLLAAIYGAGVLVGAVLAAVVFGTLGVLPFVLVPRGRRERYTMAAAAGYARFVVQGLLAARVRVDGRVALAPGEGALFLSNHRSWLDPLVLMAWTRSNGLSKSEIFWLPFVGFYGWLAGSVFFDRRDKRDRERARREVRALLKAGHRLHVFPEGTRSKDGELGERIYLNLAMDAFHDDLPVVCCALWGTERALPPRRFQAWPGRRVRLVIGPTLHPCDHPDSRSFARACWAEVTSRVDALRAEEEGRPGPSAGG